VGRGGIRGVATTSEPGRAGSLGRRVTLTVGQEESCGRERLMMDGKASKAVRSEIHSPEAHGANSAVWVQKRAGHGGQGSRPRPEHLVNLSQVSAPGVKYCRIKTTPRVERKDLLDPDCMVAPPLPGQGAAAWLEWVVGFIGGAKPWGRERVSGL
jgi:hypothetical protein